MTKTKVTTVLDGELGDQAAEISERTRMGMADLLRIGLIKVALEFRATGTVKLEELPPKDTQPA